MRKPEPRRHEPIELKGLPLGMLTSPVFAGTIAIEDYERNRKYVKYVGRYHCVLCGARGAQVTAYWRDVWPNGVTDAVIESDMKMCVEKNHVHRGWGKA